MCPKIQKKALTDLKIGRDTRTWLENRRKGLRCRIGTDGRRKAVKEIGREKGKIRALGLGCAAAAAGVAASTVDIWEG